MKSKLGSILRGEEAEEFKKGIIRSMKQYRDGNVKTFDNVEDLITDLHESDTGMVKHTDDDIVTDENRERLEECIEIYEKKPIKLDGLPESMRNNVLKSMERNEEAFEKLRKL